MGINFCGHHLQPTSKNNIILNIYSILCSQLPLWDKDVKINRMDEISRLVKAIHDSPGRVMIVAAGAGAQALAWLLGVAGASRTLLEALIPYDEASFCDFLDQRPQQFVAVETAGLMAGRAVKRARQLWQVEEDVIGLACTATIITDRPKRGEHRAHVATWTKDRIAYYNLYLCKGTRDRNGEEEMVSRVLLNALAAAYGLKLRLALPLVPGDRYEEDETDLAAVTNQLYRGEIDFFSVMPDGQLTTKAQPKALLCGSFNPLHEGHLRLAEVATNILHEETIFELTAVNADKPALNPQETLHRLLQFAGRHQIIVSNAATFVAKARLFPGTTFVVGYDTAVRVLQPRFYGDDPEKMLAALTEIRDRGCDFLVAGRSDVEGTFFEAANLNAPPEMTGLFQPIPAELFRLDISATELRAIGQHFGPANFGNR